jgi:phosphoglycerate dehydrogenase-like enzyme
MAESKVPVAILDDYQHVAFLMADWSPIRDRITIDVFDDTIHDVELLAKRLQPYTIICAMRERTKFNAQLLDKLPNLKLIATTGMVNRGIDVQYANSKRIVVSGTGGRGDSTLEHIWALLLATVRHVAHEDANVKSASPQWQTLIPLGLAGKTLGLVGVGRLGAKTANVNICFSLS